MKSLTLRGLFRISGVEADVGPDTFIFSGRRLQPLKTLNTEQEGW